MEERWEELERIAPTEALVQAAGDIADTEGLRGYDAVHLASYELIAGDGTVLIAADRDLLRAARSRGHLTVAAG